MPTALELTHEEQKFYLEAVSRQPAAPELTPEEHRSREQLLERVRRAAAVLKHRFHARRVLLFGSLAHAAWFTAGSDVDLAVEGLDSKDFWKDWVTVEEIIGNRPVYLI